MKKYIVAAGLFLLMNSCLNNDFMEGYPKDQQTEPLSDHMKTSRLTLGDCITSFSAMHIKQDKLMRFLKEIMKLTI